MKKFSILTLLYFIVLGSIQAQFEGVIYFNKVHNETTEYTFTVKGSKMRIENFGKDGKLLGVDLIDFEAGTVIAMSPERKLYYDAKTKPGTAVKPTIEKTNNKKTILGYECTEWTAKIPLEDTEISYWVTDKSAGFTFFDEMLDVLNRKDKLAKYFMAIPDNKDVFPLIGEERDSDGKVRTKLVTTKIEPKSVDESLFVIPDDYQEYER